MQALANKTIVSLRKRPSAVSGLEDEVLYGMKVEILSTCPPEEEGDHAQWCYVRTHYRYEGYCRMEEPVTENCIGCACSTVRIWQSLLRQWELFFKFGTHYISDPFKQFRGALKSLQTFRAPLKLYGTLILP
jgi:hypothetical protein